VSPPLVSPFRQNPHEPTTGHKTTSYFARLAGLRYAHQRQAFESLWLTPEGYLAEGSISNVFLWLNEQLVTPPLDTPVLPGIARADVLDLAGQLGMQTAERKLTIDDLLDADEVMLTNSLAEVVPVVRIERKPIGSEKPGPVFEELHEAYELLAQQECQYAGEDE
jgi:branched-subunit amino acid aminotransferase/4-amino-4-deoxychorismate lyase